MTKYLASNLLGRPANEKQMREVSEAWKPHRALALTYLYAELAHQRALEADAEG